MTLIRKEFTAPTYYFNTSDVSGSKVSGATYIGALAYDVDLKIWYVVSSDLTLKEVIWPAA